MQDISKEIEEEKLDVEARKNWLEDNESCLRQELELLLWSEDYNAVISYFENEKGRKFANLDNRIAIVGIMASIYQEEQYESITPHIFEGIKSISLAEEKFLLTKFAMWKMEFMEQQEVFLEYLEQNHVSMVFLKHLIQSSSFDKINVAFGLAMLWKEKKCWGKAFVLLNYVSELLPEEDVVYCEMADICMETHQYEMAMECVKKIENTSGILAEYEKKWGI